MNKYGTKMINTNNNKNQGSEQVLYKNDKQNNNKNQDSEQVLYKNEKYKQTIIKIKTVNKYCTKMRNTSKQS